MAEVGMNLYELNKSLMGSLPPMTDRALTHELAGVGAWFSYEKDKYFMLLCHERRDYTLFHLAGTSKHCWEATQELKETLQNRGEILEMAYDNGAYSIWIRIDEENFLYYLFPYDMGVITV